jgi:hypothetical protein
VNPCNLEVFGQEGVLRRLGVPDPTNNIGGNRMTAMPGNMPDFMDIIAGGVPPGAERAQSAATAMITLNDSMFDIYLGALAQYQKNFLAQHPVILALFSGEGGNFTLFRPGQAPVTAPPPPISYRVLKSSSHSSLVLFELVGPYLNAPGNTSWRTPMTAYRAQMQAAVDTLDDVDLPSDVRDNIRKVQTLNIAFMDECLRRGTVSYDDLKRFGKTVAPALRANIRWAGTIQVDHWMDVVAGWKTLLGKDFEKTYAASNTLCVTRQNNILFSVLAQYFGQDAFNRRLFLFETSGFETTAEQLLTLMTRIVSDRAAGEIFFGNYYLMDYELLGGDGRDAIEAQCVKRGMTPLLPPKVAFGSTAWPFNTTAGEGPTSLSDLHLE